MYKMFNILSTLLPYELYLSFHCSKHSIEFKKKQPTFTTSDFDGHRRITVVDYEIGHVT